MKENKDNVKESAELKMEFKKTGFGERLAFTIGVQTFYIDAGFDSSMSDNEERVDMFKRSLKTALDNYASQPPSNKEQSISSKKELKDFTVEIGEDEIKVSYTGDNKDIDQATCETHKRFATYHLLKWLLSGLLNKEEG